MPGENFFENTVILVTRNGMGRADQELQHKLFGTYLRLLQENNTLPAVVCFYTEGVKLVTEGPSSLNNWRKLKRKASAWLSVPPACLTMDGRTACGLALWGE